MPEKNSFADIDIEEGVRRANQIHDRILSAESEANVTLMQLKQKHSKTKKVRKKISTKRKGPTVIELRGQLKAAGLKTGGNKPDLIKRLHDHKANVLSSNHGGASTSSNCRSSISSISSSSSSSSSSSGCSSSSSSSSRSSSSSSSSGSGSRRSSRERPEVCYTQPAEETEAAKRLEPGEP